MRPSEVVEASYLCSKLTIIVGWREKMFGGREDFEAQGGIEVLYSFSCSHWEASVLPEITCEECPHKDGEQPCVQSEEGR